MLKYHYIIGPCAAVAQRYHIGAGAILVPKLHHAIYEVKNPGLADDTNALTMGGDIDVGRGQQVLRDMAQAAEGRNVRQCTRTWHNDISIAARGIKVMDITGECNQGISK